MSKTVMTVKNDPHDPRRRPIVIVLAIVMHVAWGVSFLLAGVPRTTALAWAASNPPSLMAAIYLAAGLAAAYSLFRWSPGRLSVALLIPQQFLLLLSAGSALEAVAVGAYADGVSRSRVFILDDQIPVLLLAAGHTLAIVWRGRRA
jgi:hypothetical protein